VLALRCDRGVVLASDGQVTSDAAGQPTRSRSTKLFTTPSGIAWGCAGSVGLQQTLASRLRAADPGGSPDQLRDQLARLVVPVQKRALDDHVAHADADPPELSCLFCWFDDDGPHIVSIPRTGADHQFHDGYAAIGSGDIFAALTMRSLADLRHGQLTLEQAKLVAYRAVADAIDVAALFLGPPIQMVTATSDGVDVVTRDELDYAIADAVELWKQRQRETLGPLGAAAIARPHAA
jgi:20S proteasome alpha/beta subunit